MYDCADKGTRVKQNGWELYATIFFENQLDQLIEDVERLAIHDPLFYHHKKYKLLLAIQDNIYNKVPENPNDSKYRLGTTLGKQHAHWRRVKKNNLPPRYRLFFQFRSDAKTIIYAWLNDEATLRKEGAKTDVYAVFESMLAKGKPPTTWDELIKMVTPLKNSN